jgi:predicted permease
MGAFLIAFNTVLPLFLIILTGLVFSRARLATPLWIEVLNKYALWIGFPALVVHSLLRLDAFEEPHFQLVVYNSLFIVGCILMAYPAGFILKFDKGSLRTLFLVFAFGNVAYLGMPVLRNALGDQILPVSAILAAVYLFWLFTLALVLVEWHGNEKVKPVDIALRLIKNPLLISVLAGILLVFFNVNLPGTFRSAISMFANSVTAIVLFSLGIFLGFQKKGTIKDWLVSFSFVIVIMVLFPGIFYLFLKNAPIPSAYMHASILDAAMPVGLTPYALAQQYNLDTPFAARLIVLSTLLSIIILPLWMVFLQV